MIYFEIGMEDTRKLNQLVLEEGTSTFMVLYSIYIIMLEKLTGQTENTVGTGVLGRSHTDLMNVIGLFFNTIPLRNPVDEEKQFNQLLKDVTKKTLESFENQDYPVDMLVEQLLNKGLIRRDASRNSLFDTMFALQNYWERSESVEGIEFSGIKTRKYGFERKTSRFDLFMFGTESQDTLQMELEYSTALFKPSTAQSITESYIEILHQVLEGREIKIKDITISGSLLEVSSVADKNEYMDFGF